MSSKKVPFNDAIEMAEDILLEQAKKKEQMKPHLDAKLKEIERIDNKIQWHQDKIKELESDKQYELNRMGELLDLAVKLTHSLDNGYTVKPKNKVSLEVESVPDFLVWLKANRKPQEVVEFFTGALKLTNLKKFCEAEYNEQRIAGEMEPKIDGIRFGDITFRRLTTVKKEKK